MNGLDWTKPQAAIIERMRSVLMPEGQQALVRRMGVARDLAAIQESELTPPEAYLIYTQPRLLEASADTARYKHVFSVVVIVQQSIARQQKRHGDVVDLADQMLHEDAIPVVLALSQALHGWQPAVQGFGRLVPEQGPPVGYSAMGHAYVVLRYGCEAMSAAQRGVSGTSRPR